MAQKERRNVPERSAKIQRAVNVVLENPSVTLRVETLDNVRMVLDVNLSQSVGAQRPFAALRSMFVNEGNSDVARIGLRAKDSQRWRQESVMEFMRATASELWAGRLVPSRHNTSAPDMVFRDFSPAAK